MIKQPLGISNRRMELSMVDENKKSLSEPLGRCPQVSGSRIQVFPSLTFCSGLDPGRLLDCHCVRL